MKLNAKSLLIAGIVVVAMLLEAAIIYFVMPPKGTVQAADAGQDDPVAATPVSDDSAEVLIDSFSCTNNNIAPGSVVHLSFKVIGLVPRSQHLAFEDSANKTHKTRVRQAIERIARSSNLEDLNDPSLNTIKRLIREEINKLLGKSYVTEIVINDFRMMEQ
jgi:flagellar basal body-associated protein FliL